MIPEAAVEAAAEAIVAMRQNGQENTQQEYARAALEAASPYMAAQTHDDVLDEKAREAKEEWADERDADEATK